MRRAAPCAPLQEQGPAPARAAHVAAGAARVTKSSHAPTRDHAKPHPNPPSLADGGSTASLRAGKAMEAKGGGIA